MEQIFNLRKNAYKNYIREIYIKINEELKKKNTYFNIVPHNMQIHNYSDALTTKEVKPSIMFEENDAPEVRQKIKDKLKLHKLQG